jgi:hypothetical protein
LRQPYRYFRFNIGAITITAITVTATSINVYVCTSLLLSGSACRGCGTITLFKATCNFALLSLLSRLDTRVTGGAHGLLEAATALLVMCNPLASIAISHKEASATVGSVAEPLEVLLANVHAPRLIHRSWWRDRRLLLGRGLRS